MDRTYGGRARADTGLWTRSVRCLLASLMPPHWTPFFGWASTAKPVLPGLPLASTAEHCGKTLWTTALHLSPNICCGALAFSATTLTVQGTSWGHSMPSFKQPASYRVSFLCTDLSAAGICLWAFQLLVQGMFFCICAGVEPRTTFACIEALQHVLLIFYGLVAHAMYLLQLPCFTEPRLGLTARGHVLHATSAHGYTGQVACRLFLPSFGRNEFMHFLLLLVLWEFSPI